MLRHLRFQSPLWARRSFRHFSLVLKCHATHFANFLALLPSDTDSPTIVFCFPRSGPFSNLCQKTGKYCCILSSSTSRCTSERLFVFWLHQALQGLDVHFLYGRKTLTSAHLSRQSSTAPISLLSKRLHPTLCPSKPLATVFHLKKQTNFVATVPSTSFSACRIVND